MKITLVCTSANVYGLSFEQKNQLKSECDREVEEVVTQIRRKYEIRLKEMEAEFLVKKKELDANENKVLMNKILAEAFRSKCMDIKASTAGMQQGREFFSYQYLCDDKIC